MRSSNAWIRASSTPYGQIETAVRTGGYLQLALLILRSIIRCRLGIRRRRRLSSGSQPANGTVNQKLLLRNECSPPRTGSRRRKVVMQSRMPGEAWRDWPSTGPRGYKQPCLSIVTLRATGTDQIDRHPERTGSSDDALPSASSSAPAFGKGIFKDGSNGRTNVWRSGSLEARCFRDLPNAAFPLADVPTVLMFCLLRERTIACINDLRHPF